jgi:hypothetical protein
MTKCFKEMATTWALVDKKFERKALKKFCYVNTYWRPLYSVYTLVMCSTAFFV